MRVDGLPAVVGAYPLLEDNTTWFLAFDFDDEQSLSESRALCRSGAALGVPLYLERSRSGTGYHVWLFFDAPVEAAKARRLGQVLLATAGFSVKAFDRMFPAQDFHKGEKSLGNLIALPLQKESRDLENTVFLDIETLEVLDQWSLLASVRRCTADELDSVLLTPNDCTFAPIVKTARPRIAAVEGGTLQIGLAESLWIVDSPTVPACVRAFLRSETMLENPIWHEKAKRGHSLWNTPRYVRCEVKQDGLWHVPRGLWKRLLQVLECNRVSYTLDDQTVGHSSAEPWPISGTLRGYQKSAVSQVIRDLHCVLEAPTGAGKTRMAISVIAQRGVPTLVLVHSRALLDQWKVQIALALGLEPKAIGCTLPGGALRLGPMIAVATFQSLLKRDIGQWIEHYACLVVDECHRVPAKTFTAVIRQFRPTYLLGLTATPRRTDQMQRLIFLYLGDKIKSASSEELDRLGVIALPSYRFQTTAFECPAIDSHSTVLGKVTMDGPRNRQIVDDVLGAVEENHVVLVLTDRKQQCDLISEMLTPKVGVAVLYGSVGKKDRQRAVAGIESNEIQVLIATANLLGEGFDCPPLSALVVASPMGGSPRLQQLIGRITRIALNKPKPVVYDYRDALCPMLEAMFQKRLRLFRSHLKDERLPVELRLARAKPTKRATISPKPRQAKRPTEPDGQLFLF